MSQQNNGNSEAAMAFALIGTMAIFFIAIIFAIAAFVSFCFTILCIFAWNDGLTFGKLTITREEARAFVGRGLLGAFLLPMFVVFCAVLFDTPIRDDFWIYILIAGYAGGSVGVGMLLHSDAQQAANAMEAMPRLCCTNGVMARLPLYPGRPIPRFL
jgi:hypothetical protein